VRLLVRLADLYRHASLEPERFAGFVAALREKHRRKRNFIALLNASGLG
jgi:hypothetical protein